MKYRIIGNDLRVSAIGLGCMGMSHAYGEPSSENDAIKLIETAVDLGCTFFDTAEVYGTADNPHHNEELVGKALKNHRNNVVIATKFGISFDTNSGEVNKPLVPNSNPDVIRKSVEGSLKRLNTDHIDLYYQHRYDPNVPIEEVAGVMSDLIKEGKITHWGLSEANEDTIRRANAVCKVTAIQNRYSMMYRNYEKLFATLEELDIGLVAFSPLANGILTNKYNSNSRFDPKLDYRSTMAQFKPESFEKNKNLFKLLDKLSSKHNATPSQIALAWMICKKPYIVPIPGTRKTNRLIENMGSADIVLSNDDVLSIDKSLDNMEMSEVFGGTRVVKSNA